MHSSNNRITSQLTATAKSASRYFKRYKLIGEK